MTTFRILPDSPLSSVTTRLVMRRLAFTLVELLVVVAIIGILAAFLMPSLMKAVQSARQVSCVNNLRQIGLGLHVYIDDSNNYLPPKYYGTGAADYWAQSLVNEKIVNARKLGALWKCPSDAAQTSLPIGMGSTSYGVSVTLKTPASAGTMKVSAVSRPWSRRIVFLDSMFTECNPWLAARYPEPNHDRKANILYLEGNCRSAFTELIKTSDFSFTN